MELFSWTFSKVDHGFVSMAEVPVPDILIILTLFKLLIMTEYAISPRNSNYGPLTIVVEKATNMYMFVCFSVFIVVKM